MEDNEGKLAEVLSGGAYKGFPVYLPYMKAREDAGFKDTIIYSSSMGAWFGAPISLGVSFKTVNKAVEDHNQTLESVFKLFPHLFHLLYRNGKNGSKDHLQEELNHLAWETTDGLERLLEETIGDPKMKDVPQLNIMGTDYSLAKPVIINSETSPDTYVKDAVLASSAIAVPPIFPPRVINIDGKDRIIVDAGLSRNLPIDFALKDENVSRAVCIDLLYAYPEREIPRGKNPLEHMTLSNAFSGDAVVRTLFEYFLRLDYDHAANSIITPEINGRKIPTLYLTPDTNWRDMAEFNMDHIKEVAKEQYRYMKKSIKEFNEATLGLHNL